MKVEDVKEVKMVGEGIGFERIRKLNIFFKAKVINKICIFIQFYK